MDSTPEPAHRGPDPGSASVGSRPCVPMVVPAGPAGLVALLPALGAALAGDGPAIAPMPADAPVDYRARLTAALRPEDPVPGDVAVVVATSGSTGDPAGVLLPASALRAAAEGFAARYGRHQWVAALPLQHAGGLMVAVRSVVDGTAPVAAASLGGAQRFTVAGLADATRAARADADDVPLAISLVPAMLTALADAGQPGIEVLRAYDVVLVGGAAAPSDLIDPLRDRGVRIVRSYGMTETCGGVAFDGVPLAGATVTAGEDRRLTICAEQVALGYRGGRAPERWTARGGTRCFQTDDLGHLDAKGRVHVAGRADDVVQVGGSSVSLGAVAARLRADVGVAEAEVVPVPDPRLGTRLVAFVVPAGPGGTPGVGGPTMGTGAQGPGTSTSEGLARRLAEGVERTLGRAARPRTIQVLADLPMLPSGKPDRQRLLDLARDLPG